MIETPVLDVVVTGGGPVGAAAALGLHARGMRVALIEAREAQSAPLTDTRPLALSYGSRLVLDRLGVWDALAAGTTPIERIHVSQQGRFGRTLMTAAEAGLPALGYIADYAAVVAALDDAVARSGLETLRGTRVVSIAHDPASARVTFDSPGGEGVLVASLIAVADGNADALGAEVREIDYGQSAVAARVVAAAPRRFTAYERFTPQGPLALLPSGDGYAVIWTTGPQRAQWLHAAPEEDFLRALTAAFGERAGPFTQVSARAVHRVALRVARHAWSGRAVMLGNAAQTLHPVAGQGLNLGLRDAWELAEEVARRGAADAGLPQAYGARRRIDRRGGIALTHALVKVFSNDSAIMGFARGAGLTLLDALPPAKKFFMQRMEFGTRG